jgi:hypothetical protein
MFLRGSLGNEEELRDLFTKIYALYIDDETLTFRLATRTTNDWGKQPHELEQTLAHHQNAYKKYRQYGDEIIDATEPLNKVVEATLAGLER